MTPTELLTTDQAVITVPQAGEVIGQGQSASYDAAKRGDLPTIRVGARYLVPVAKLRELLGMPTWPSHDDAPAEVTREGVKPSTDQLPAEEVRHVEG